MAQNKQFIVVHQQILELDSLSFSEKLVLSRIAGFEAYYESKEHLSAFFGGTINPLTCRKIKAKLVALGYIIVIKDTGRGKVYQCDFDKLGIPKPEESKTQEKVAQEQIIGETAIESASQSSTTMTPYNKVIKKNNIDSKESILAQEPNREFEEDSSKSEKRTEFGNHDINEAFDQWQDATGYDLKSNKYERRAMFNLLRRKDIQAFGGFKPLVLLVKEANHISNQFAPKIIKPSELGGKYSKFEKLVEWSKRKSEESNRTTDAKSNKFIRPLTECEDALIRSYFKPCPYVRSTKADDDGPTDEDIEKAIGENKQESKWDSTEPDFYEKMREIAFGKSKKKGSSNEAE